MELYVRPNSGELTAPRLYLRDEHAAVCVTGFHVGPYAALGYDAPQFEFYQAPGGGYIHLPAIYDAQQEYWYAEVPQEMLATQGLLQVYLVLPNLPTADTQKFKTVFSAQVPVCGHTRPVPFISYDNAAYKWGEEQG